MELNGQNKFLDFNLKATFIKTQTFFSLKEKNYFTMKKEADKKKNTQRLHFEDNIKRLKFKRSAQISVFIVIAILIVAAIVLYFIIQENFLNTGNEKIPLEVQPIYSSVQECIKKTAENDIYYIGQTGGYFTTPNISTDYGIAYYYNKGDNLLPLKTGIEKELQNYMDYMLPFCTRGFSNYPDFNVKTQSVKTTAKIQEGKVAFNVVYPMTISKENKNYFFQNFGSIEIPVRLDRIYKLAYNITQDTIKNKNNICITCMNADATDLDLYIEMNDHADNETVIFIIRDAKSNLFDADYRFIFANKYEK